MNKTLSELLAELAKVESAIKAEKARQKLQKVKVNSRNIYKHFDLQQAYVNSCKGL